jgi:predicted RNA-binding protein with PIN domain
MKPASMDDPQEIYLIDGYNLLRRGFAFRDGDDLQAARERLEVRLREFLRSADPGTKIVLFYDGAAMVDSDLSPSRTDPSLRTIFTMPPTTADEAILEECRKLRERGLLFVVSSDRKDILRNLKGLPARARTSEEFADILDASLRKPGPGRPPRPEGRAGEERGEDRPAGGPGPGAGEKPRPEDIAPGEVEEWLRAFSRPKPPSGRRDRGRR